LISLDFALAKTYKRDNSRDSSNLVENELYRHLWLCLLKLPRGVSNVAADEVAA
jgi:hypothetical protein